MFFLDQAREGILHFTDTEIKVLTLLVHYECYCLEKLESPIFNRKPKRYYIDEIKSVIKAGGQVRRGDELLSSIVSEEMSKLIVKMERGL